VLVGAVVVASVPWMAGSDLTRATVVSWTAWATGQASDVPEQTYGTSPLDSSITGSDLSNRFHPPAPPPRPQSPLAPQPPQHHVPIVTYGVAPSPTPTVRPVTVPLVETTPTPVATPSVFPRTQVCLPLYGPGARVPIGVTTVRGAASDSAVMTWWHNGDLGAIAYWVGVQTFGKTPVTRWIHLTPPTGCHDVVFTVTGLTRGRPYLLLLDLESRTPETGSGISRRTVNQVQWSSCPDSGGTAACV
jgi:hypothetical protein